MRTATVSLLRQMNIPGEVIEFLRRALLLFIIWKGLYLIVLQPAEIPDAWLVRYIGNGTAAILNLVHDKGGFTPLHARRMQVALQTGAALLVNSRHTLDELYKWADQHDLCLPPVAVAPLAPAPLPPVTSISMSDHSGGRPLPVPYFVVLGTIEPRKNHLLLLHIWRD